VLVLSDPQESAGSVELKAIAGDPQGYVKVSLQGLRGVYLTYSFSLRGGEERQRGEGGKENPLRHKRKGSQFSRKKTEGRVLAGVFPLKKKSENSLGRFLATRLACFAIETSGKKDKSPSKKPSPLRRIGKREE